MKKVDIARSGIFLKNHLIHLHSLDFDLIVIYLDSYIQCSSILYEFAKTFFPKHKHNVQVTAKQYFVR